MKSITSEKLKLWRWYFVSKSSKLYVDFKIAIKLVQNAYRFEDNCVWACCGNLCQLWQEYMWSLVNVLKNGPNILDTTKRWCATQFVWSEWNISTKVPPWNFISVLDPLTRWFPEGVLKQELSGIHITTFFGNHNFGNIEGMELIFFPKCSEFSVDFKVAIKFPENVHGFEDNCVWTCCANFSLLSQQ